MKRNQNNDGRDDVPLFCNSYLAKNGAETYHGDPRHAFRKKFERRPAWCDCGPPRRWQPPSIGVIDTHCHLEAIDGCEALPEACWQGNNGSDGWWEKVGIGAVPLVSHVLDAQPKELLAVISSCCDPSDIEFYEALAQAWDTGEYTDQRLYWSVGVHPYKADEFEKRFSMQPDLENRMLALAAHPRCVAVGECGLDYCKAYETYEVQRRMFKRICSLAVRVKKPLVVHARDSPIDTLKILKEHVPTDWPIHVHGYTSPVADAEELLSAFSNLHVGFCGAITKLEYHGACGYCAPTWEPGCKYCDGNPEWVRRDLEGLIRIVPLDRMLVETDAPYMPPRSLGWAVCQPWMVFETAIYVAEVRGISVEEVIENSNRNARRLYSGLAC